jgi:hypothetical protein
MRTLVMIAAGLVVASLPSISQAAICERGGGVSLDYFKYVVFQDPKWAAESLNLDVDVTRLDNLDSGLIGLPIRI